MKKVGDIRYGNVDETMQRLQRGIRSGGITTLTGSGGADKSRMLKELVLEEPRIVEADQVAFVQMMQPNRRLLGKDRSPHHLQ